MVTQYPHTIIIQSLQDDSTRDDEGNWQASGEPVTRAYDCRAESNTTDGTISTVDGNMIVYAWVIYMASGIALVKVGSKVTVTNGDEDICTGTVKRFSRGQLNVRLWL